ncbi:cytochrome c oxidase assembly factor Coa1 family protein [Magnetovibrio sp.]|uniref:cytochrome c oxidase assembly factor Coa1 family protein n=1 Tax=Magnetovibrio sp. TaxID=2024836 RepID=UPI002F92D3CD
MPNRSPVHRPSALPPELPGKQPAELPIELRGWNWGAFFLNWVWGIAHNTPIALLMFVPGVNIVMLFVLGAKGNAWAWANNTWRDVEHFKRTQRLWARVGWGAFIGIPLMFAAMFALVTMLFTSSDAYRLTVDAVRDHPALERRLGLPVEPSTWWTTGNIQTTNDEGWAELSFDVQGPRGDGTVFVYLDKRGGVWTIRQLNVLTEDGERIVLVEPADAI